MSGTYHLTSTVVLSTNHSTTNGFPPQYEQDNKSPNDSYKVKTLMGRYAPVLAFA
jgi:hypothetical protein